MGISPTEPMHAALEVYCASLPYYPVMLGAGMKPDPDHLDEIVREWTRETNEYLAAFRR